MPIRMQFANLACHMNPTFEQETIQQVTFWKTKFLLFNFHIFSILRIQSHDFNSDNFKHLLKFKRRAERKKILFIIFLLVKSLPLRWFYPTRKLIVGTWSQIRKPVSTENIFLARLKFWAKKITVLVYRWTPCSAVV